MKPTASSRNQTVRLTGGFSLIELLVCVSIIAFLATFAVILLTRSRENALSAQGRTNASRLVMLSEAAMGSGNQALRNVSSAAEAVELLSTGVNGDGLFADSKFQLPGMSGAAKTQALRYLDFRDGKIEMKFE